VNNSNHSPAYRTLLNIANAHAAIDKMFDRELSGFGLSMEQWDILRHLSTLPGASGAEIARLAGISPQAVATMLQRMEKAELVTRRSARQGRALEAYLTTKGKELLAYGERIAIQVDAQAFSTYTPEEREQFNDLLVRCIKNFEQSEL
jgi:DNA-binding MarR family transcriptional regulator